MCVCVFVCVCWDFVVVFWCAFTSCVHYILWPQDVRYPLFPASFVGTAYRCQLSYHSYVREVCGDGSVLGGVELEIAVV